MESLRRDRQRQQEESAKTSEQLIKVFTECMEDKVLLNVKVEKSMTRKVAFTRAATLMGQLKTSGRYFSALLLQQLSHQISGSCERTLTSLSFCHVLILLDDLSSNKKRPDKSPI